MKNYQVVIPAAGQGKRMNAGKNKQFLLINQIPLLIHTLRVFEEDLLCDKIILVVNKEEIEQMKRLTSQYAIKKVEKIVVGGSERQESVYEGLKAVQGNPIVLVHDGARPFIKQPIIDALVDSVMKRGASIVATPVKDTVKQVSKEYIHHTVDRTSLWAAQTPQAFRHEQILRAHEHAVKVGYTGTDDASLLEHNGEKVYIVPGDYENIKITTPEDLIFGEAIIKSRKEGNK
ncbi:2-C-methyl-D-erythritol 4-phosphate cytidylyltransferase [Evansella cellulosilytica]|uniref:2-C-methyl-D-erythritol 4-phosphate cytidylyltransferase n=1 Tax=Evansella cellulosilytica (strain ATCC 21833 / DSM 2522 / FERM P-1141 / JCM 9156 / N-4) TaxID=649639 RepID=E6TSG7_EVAC2|nr:2-C-methyl-D-erythritol 4-phosphate cytidylyltransferase [Evansella cellulosilytica]ADU28382.1 2-C-methyl-D-erythritol 4-phosphate cytidylyltransferase [Evansella cellulosilytica DSM 2522]